MLEEGHRTLTFLCVCDLERIPELGQAILPLNSFFPNAVRLHGVEFL
jgi:hypothetical protein